MKPEPGPIPRQWFLWGLLLLVCLWWPYELAARLAPPGSEFLGALVNPEDLSVYLAAIRQGSEGDWLFAVTFTPENITPKLTYPFYLALGRLQAAFDVDGLFLFQVARLASAGVLLLSLLLWLPRLGLGAARDDAFFLITLSGGFGWAFLGLGVILPDIHVAEWTPFLSMFYAPHFALGIAAELGLMAGLLNAARQREVVRFGPALLAAAGALAVALLYPYKIVPMAATVLLFLVAETWLCRRLNFSLTASSVVAGGILGLTGLYYAVVARADPYWEATHVVQNAIPSPDLLAMMLGWGLPLIMAMIAGYRIVRCWRDMPTFLRLCTLWAVLGILFLYLPVSFQGRFALGVYVPICILAAWSLHQVILPALAAQTGWLERLSPTPLATVRRLLLILAMPSVFAFQGMVVQRTSFFPEFYYLSQAEIRAAHWLADHSEANDLVLAGNRMGNYLPRYYQGRVFIGQYYVTVDSNRKAVLASQFYDPATADDWRLAFLAEWGITVIYYGYYEAQVGPPPDLPGWDIAYNLDNVIIYQKRD
jgi:hypothetical protein